MLRSTIFAVAALSSAVLASAAHGGEIVAPKVDADLSVANDIHKEAFANAKEEVVSLMAQPMAIPRPKVTTTSKITVQAIHNASTLAIRLRWADTEKNEAGRLGEYSDAVAIEFPVKDNANPPPIFMGAKGNPVHVFHWRAQYQADKERGMRTIKDLYPNMNIDVYPMEFPTATIDGVTDAKREVYSYGKAAGNPQSYAKKGVDELMAEGFGTSAVIENIESDAQGHWENGEWDVIISRPLKREGGSVLPENGGSFVGFAVWQGGKDEVGARKSITMSWTPLKLAQ